MKMFRLFLMASLMLTVISCSSDNDEPKVEKLKTVTIEMERKGDYLPLLEEAVFIGVTDKTIDYSKSEWGNLQDNLDGTFTLEKMNSEPKVKETITFKQKNVNFKLLPNYIIKADVSAEQEDEIDFDTKVVIKIDGKVINENMYEFKTNLPYVIFQYPN